VVANPSNHFQPGSKLFVFLGVISVNNLSSKK